MKTYLCFSVLLLASFFGFAQNKIEINKENADCLHPIELMDSINGPSNAPSGYGETMEITGKFVDELYFQKEHNTVWYYFTIKETGDLCFDIIPLSLKDDYDFLLFKYSGSQFCNQVKEKKIKPLRSNISRNNLLLQSKTGISMDAKQDYVHSGPGDAYSRSVPVKKGEVYYLVLDNVYANGKGHSIRFNLMNPQKTLSVPLEKSSSNAKPSWVINVNVTDKESGELLNSDIAIKSGSSTVKTFEHTSSCFFSAVLDTKYEIYVSSKGYLSYTSQPITNTIGINSTINVQLEKIHVGKKVVIDNIYFEPNLAVFKPESQPALNKLYASLQENPSVQIEIQGHVNAPGMGPEVYMELSIHRAQAVYDYLISKGISSNRLTYKGFSNTKMLFPRPMSEEQSAKNRRVEILITSE